jgi:hypothetical protein
MSGASLSEPAQSSVDERTPWVVVTNRSNVLEWLSSSLTLPRAAYGKYYRDTLEFLNNGVPVVAAPVSRDLVAHAESEQATFCVLAEIPADAVTTVDGRRFGLLAPTTLDVVRALHVESEDQRREFLARSFDNLDIGRIDVNVTPELFDGVDGVDAAQFRDELTRSAVEKPAIPWDAADRLGGARALALRAVSGDVAHVRAVVSMLIGEMPKRTRRKPKAMRDWLAVTPALREFAPKKTSIFDERLFLAAAAVLLAGDRRDALDPSAVLGDVDRLLDSDSSIATADREHWRKARERIAGVIDGDSAFTRFRSEEPRTEKALLLALIRSEPHEVLAWGDEDIGAHNDDLLLAAVLVGLSAGRKTLSWKLRPAAIDLALAARELEDCGLAAPAHTSAVVERDGELLIEVDGAVARALPLPPRPVTSMLEEIDLRDPEITAGLLDLCRRHDLGRAVTTTISVEGDAQLRSRAGGIDVESRGFPRVDSRIDTMALGQCLVDASPEALADFRELLNRAPREG